ncbi:hypothetical protein M378DRAFT_163235 [Amanita muscaria Koide BX008]|uniref:Uncharacterized protein n=1 Tax=Amanita muscaria (strain Koide BX008) TaxID=946122 RepID=A0A0C2SMJ7_AMAMK|nr:hypothetical protein M378DRAFT_163235 [Amanita muscaria Koide BX008]
MHTAVATSYPTPAAFDAGRQPFSYIPFNTPQTKSVTGRKHIADDVFCPQATSIPRKTPFNRGDDEDIPLAFFMELRSASLGPSTVKPPGPISRQAAEVDDDEDLPLVKVKERMMKKFSLRPMIKRIVRRQPPTKPKKFVQTVRDLGPRSTAMMCIVPDCPYDWHVHRVW